MSTDVPSPQDSPLGGSGTITPGTTTRTAAVYDAGGKRVGEIELAAGIFDVTPHTAVLHEAVTWQLAGRRSGTHSTLTRGEVNRSTRKLYRQKGTGRARHGGRGAPVFVGGGIAFGPKPRTYAYSVPKKVRRLAIRSALSAKAGEGRVAVLESLDLDRPKTSALVNLLRAVGAGRRVLLVTATPNEAVVRSAANVPGLCVMPPSCLNVHTILASDQLLITREALARLEEVLAS
ncbi:MAG TPA: 50S ribosomal protein L4 [bacterium]|nr:50S ribosomal protein L4 [bacterium]